MDDRERHDQLCHLVLNAAVVCQGLCDQAREEDDPGPILEMIQHRMAALERDIHELRTHRKEHGSMPGIDIDDLHVDDLGPNASVTENFRLQELIRSETAARHNIDNTFPSDDRLRSAVYLAQNMLQPVRDRFGAYTPNSVFRCQELDRVLKRKPPDWMSDSQHTEGEAADIEVPELPNIALATWIMFNLEFDQLILECHDKSRGPNSGWVHVSLVRPELGRNRRETLSYVKSVTNNYIYVRGLRESPE